MFKLFKGKLHCAYLNLDNNARNALRVAQYNQTIRQEKLDANSSSSTTANINNNTKLIDPSKDNILVQQQQPVGIVQSLAHGISIVPPHPSTAAAAGSQNAPMMATGPGSYPMAATVLPNNQTLVTAVPQQLQAGMSIPPFANSILAPGIQANPSPSITTNNLNSSIANTTSNTNNTNADMTSSGSTSGNIQNIAWLLSCPITIWTNDPIVNPIRVSGLCSNSFIGSSTAITTTTSAITE